MNNLISVLYAALFIFSTYNLAILLCRGQVVLKDKSTILGFSVVYMAILSLHVGSATLHLEYWRPSLDTDSSEGDYILLWLSLALVILLCICQDIVKQIFSLGKNCTQ